MSDSENKYLFHQGLVCDGKLKSGWRVYPCELAYEDVVWIFEENRAKIGLATIRGEILIQPCYGKVEPFVNGFAKVNNGYWCDNNRYKEFVDGKWGVINSFGELVVGLEYDSIEFEDDDTFTVSRKLNCYQVNGRLNKNGELIIKDKNGKYILASNKYDWQEDFDSEGRSKVFRNFEIGYVNEKFQFLIEGKEGKSIPEEFEWGYYCTENTFVGIKNGMQGVFGYDGSELISPIYRQIHFVGHNLYATMGLDGKYSIINKKGKCVNEALFDKVYPFGENVNSSNKTKKIENALYAIVNKGGLYGAINVYGELILATEYKTLEFINRNVFYGDFHYIDFCGRRVVVRGEHFIPIADDYESAELLDNGLILVRKNRLYGCINEIGDIIIPIQYIHLSYSEGLFVAVAYDKTTHKRKKGVLDILNKEIIPLNEEYIDIRIEKGLILYRFKNFWGAFTTYGKLICEPKYSHVIPITDSLIKVAIVEPHLLGWSNETNTYWGLINIDGKEILPIDRRNSNNHIWKCHNFIAYTDCYERIGYLDVTGREILKPIYIEIGDFIDGYAIVAVKSYDFDDFDCCKTNKIYGVINNSFKEVIPCVFSHIEYEKETGLFKTDVGNKTTDGRYVVEVNGEILLVNEKYKYCHSFHNDCAIAVQEMEEETRYGLIDTNSQDIFPPIYQWLELLDNGLYKFKKDNLYGLLDSQGNILVPNKYHKIGDFKEKLAVTYIEHGVNALGNNIYLFGFIDESGNEVLSSDYEYMGKRNEGKVVLMRNNVWGMFDTTTLQMQIILNISYLGCCNNGFCRFNTGGNFDKSTLNINGGLWGYMNQNGNIVIAPQYDAARGFSDGMAAVKLNGKWGFINSEGIIVVPCEYDEVESSFEDGKGKLVKDDEIYIFDKSGSQIDTHDKPRDDDDYYDGGYYDDTPSIYDNPYYNDNLDMDQQSIEFWNNF